MPSRCITAGVIFFLPSAGNAALLCRLFLGTGFSVGNYDSPRFIGARARARPTVRGLLFTLTSYAPRNEAVIMNVAVGR